MRLRKNIFPRTLADIGCTLLITVAIPTTFIFEMAIVLPEFHDYGTFFYNFTFLAGLFLVFNLKSNMLACMLVDTSIKHEMLNPPDDHKHRKLWRLCAVCETLAPPRSWHCNVCNTCILKRDHHCMFAGCCVGMKNHRYFIMFLIFFCIGTAYTTAYNSMFFWWVRADDFLNWPTLFKMVCPMLMFTIDSTWNNLYLLIYELNVIGFAYSLVLLMYHGKIILRGGVCHEKNAPKYDLGWKRNLEMVLGERKHLVWLSPFISSELPHDGIHWESVLDGSEKNR